MNEISAAANDVGFRRADQRRVDRQRSASTPRFVASRRSRPERGRRRLTPFPPVPTDVGTALMTPSAPTTSAT